MTTAIAPTYEPEDDGPSEDLLQKLSSLAQKMRQAELTLEKKQTELDEAKEVLRQYVEVLIPNAMQEARQKEITTLDNYKISVKDKIRASIPEASQAKAFAWLEKTGNARIIKHEFKILFAMEDDAWAKKFQRDLAARKRPVDCRRKDFVENPTLVSFLTKQLEAGVDVPLEIFGGFKQKFAKVELVK